ncbi:HlyD family secretion protein [Siccirubricoccus sp. KC 17139]|uniref:HlyD family secretion protein n=1 Tax=Siccirubricoccus soli TaxID=2899147 RepID=A0ABT1D5H0_9PROT|nr:HlyD family secretion protein [Siccirubricoccus soli]MCO6417173.1 HlyD family secretion protein [Siccirubricoccus soli]MCP2683308.1 HlyD family secretion protein [Siccirubricoccus soli]
MKRPLAGIALTLAAVILAGFAGWRLWTYYMLDPWTRDGRVRADVVGIAADVSGLVATVRVRDNQPVQQGEVLFEIDRARFELAVQQADAAALARWSALQQAQRDAQRVARLDTSAVSVQAQERARAEAEQAMASYQQAVAERDLARLNLDRSWVRAPVNGVVTNMDLRPGNYVAAGQAVFALVDTDTLRVEGYFEETKLPRIAPGAPATVRLMGETQPIRGRVESIAGGIEDRERAAGPSLLANVNPTFTWVRLAQRVPVRIALEEPPPGLRLLPGRTATVSIGMMPETAPDRHAGR